MASAGCLSVSKRCTFAILYNFTIKPIGIWGCRMYTQSLGNSLSDRPSHLLRSLLINCPSFTTVLVTMAYAISCQISLDNEAMLEQDFHVVESSELSILLSSLQLAVIVCIESKHFLDHLFSALTGINHGTLLRYV